MIIIEPTPVRQSEFVSCECCGTVLKANVIEQFDDIRGLEYAKRALEVAAVGDHPIVFLSNDNHSDTRRLAALARHHFNLKTWALLPCPCGNYGSATRQCTCRPAVIAKYRKRPAWKAAMEAGVIFIEVTDQQDRGKRVGEPHATVMERIAQAKARTPPSSDIDQAGATFLRAARRQLHLTAQRELDLIEVGRTIARMASIHDSGDESKTVSAIHLAEATQYRPRWVDPAEGMDE